ncbi:MAG TPA: Uma2 family endonuclease [Candidatus Bipolaricaulota bacterium]
MAKTTGLQQIILTYEDYVHLPDDGKRYEILEGEVFVTPAPKTKHQIISLNLAVVLQQHVRKHKLGRVLTAPTDVILSRTNVLQPDLLFLSNERLRYLSEKNVQGAPDLVVEILSEFTEDQDRTAKRQLYARYGVRVYWLIDPDAETLEAYELDPAKRSFRHNATYHGSDGVQSALFPKLKLKLQELWL